MNNNDYLNYLDSISKKANIFKPTSSINPTTIDSLMAHAKSLYHEVSSNSNIKLDSLSDIINALKSIVTIGSLPHNDKKFWDTVGSPGSANFNLRNEILSTITDLQEALARESIRKNLDQQLNN